MSFSVRLIKASLSFIIKGRILGSKEITGHSFSAFSLAFSRSINVSIAEAAGSIIMEIEPKHIHLVSTGIFSGRSPIHKLLSAVPLV